MYTSQPPKKKARTLLSLLTHFGKDGADVVLGAEMFQVLDGSERLVAGAWLRLARNVAEQDVLLLGGTILTKDTLASLLQAVETGHCAHVQGTGSAVHHAWALTGESFN